MIKVDIPALALLNVIISLVLMWHHDVQNSWYLWGMIVAIWVISEIIFIKSMR